MLCLNLVPNVIPLVAKLITFSIGLLGGMSLFHNVLNLGTKPGA